MATCRLTAGHLSRRGRPRRGFHSAHYRPEYCVDHFPGLPGMCWNRLPRRCRHRPLYPCGRRWFGEPRPVSRQRPMRSRRRCARHRTCIASSAGQVAAHKGPRRSHQNPPDPRVTPNRPDPMLRCHLAIWPDAETLRPHSPAVPRPVVAHRTRPGPRHAGTQGCPGWCHSHR